jgi:hypothetical protein
VATRTRTTRLTPEDFVDDSHAAKYLGELDTRPEVARRLLAILNDPANEQRLVDAEPAHDRPALSGVVRSVDSDDVIHQVLASGSSGYRFRQTVGVAVRLKMEKPGWATSGRKGADPGAHYFTKAERYTRRREIDLDHTDQALAALSSMEHMGDDDERRATGAYLIDALAATRAAEGRVF